MNDAIDAISVRSPRAHRGRAAYRRSIYLRGTPDGLFRPLQLLGFSVMVCELQLSVGERGSSRERKSA